MANETLKVAYTLAPDTTELSFLACAVEGNPLFKFVAGMGGAEEIDVRKEAFLGFGAGRRLNPEMVDMTINAGGKVTVIVDQAKMERELARGWRGRIARTLSCNVVESWLDS